MSQLWHAHWAEDSFKPTRLGNWQVPNWHPKFPCRRHCVTTKFQADRSGRLLPDQPRPKRSPWGGFKGTWELPLKIDRKLARMLSAPPRYMQTAWEAHKTHYTAPCPTNPTIPKKMVKKAVPNNFAKTTDRAVVKSTGIAKRKTHHEKPEGNNNIQHVKNVNRHVHKEKEKNVDEHQEAEKVDQDDGEGDEKEVPQEQGSIDTPGQSDRDEHKEIKNYKCLCEQTSDKISSVATKAIRKNICNVHRRLRL